MKLTEKELISEIENRFQMLITISGLYSAILYNFFHLNDAANSDHIFLQSSTLIVYYILAWVLFEVTKKYLDAIWLKWFNVVLIVTIVSFISPMAIATANVQTLVFWQQILLYLSSWVQLATAVATILFPVVMVFFQDKLRDFEMKKSFVRVFKKISTRKPVHNL
jgi:hypothetical protein